MAESADATDLKSVDGDIVRVRPPLAPQFSCHCEPVAFTGAARSPPKEESPSRFFLLIKHSIVECLIVVSTVITGHLIRHCEPPHADCHCEERFLRRSNLHTDCHTGTCCLCKCCEPPHNYINNVFMNVGARHEVPRRGNPRQGLPNNS